MIGLFVTLIIALIIFALLWWVITLIQFPPGFPIWVLQVLLALFLVLFLVVELLPLAGHPVLR